MSKTEIEIVERITYSQVRMYSNLDSIMILCLLANGHIIEFDRYNGKVYKVD